MKKRLVKSILIGHPISIEYQKFIPSWLKPAAHQYDRKLHQWALSEADRFSEEDLYELQLTRLRNILTHAKKHVSYWKNTFSKLNFYPEAISRTEDIERLPVASRSIMRAIPIDLLTASSIPRERWVSMRTSGSTAEPFILYQDSEDLFRRLVGTINSFRVAGKPFWEPLFILGLDAHHQLDGAGFRFSDLENRESRMRELYPYIEQYQPQFVVTTPSTLERFLHYLRKDEREYFFRAIQCVGESMQPDRRAVLAQAFNAKIFSSYGSAECSRIAIECERNQHHLAPWNCYIEILDSDGRKKKVGQVGDIVITGFENEVMPFIRYRIGDRGMINPESCACGRLSPIIVFTGRESITIRTSPDDEFSLIALSTLIAKDFSHDVNKFQLIRTGDKVFVFRYVLHDPLQSAHIPGLLNSLYSLTGKNVLLRLEHVSEILPSAAGKTTLYIDTYTRENTS